MKKHALSTRLWHWVNAGAIIVLFVYGLFAGRQRRAI